MRGGGINKTEEKVVEEKTYRKKGQKHHNIDKVMLLPFYL